MLNLLYVLCVMTCEVYSAVLTFWGGIVMIHVEINKVNFQGGRSLTCCVASLTCGSFDHICLGLKYALRIKFFQNVKKRESDGILIHYLRKMNMMQNYGAAHLF